MTRFIVSWVGVVTRYPRRTMAIVLALTALAAFVGVTRFHMNSDLSELIAQDASWRVQFDEFEREFPQLVKTVVVVVDSASVRDLETVTQQIVPRLLDQPDMFTSIAAPGSEPFFRDHALLYMGIDDLDDMADRLAQAQPWLTAVAGDPSLRGIMDLIGDGVANQPPQGFASVVELIATSAQQAARDDDATIAWTDELFEISEPRYQLIFAQAAMGPDGRSRTDAQVVGALREVISQLAIPNGTHVRLTGELALQHEEIEAAVTGVSLAGWLCLVLLLLVMIVGVRSVKIILATFAMLVIGVVWTTACAMLTVGEYNTLSVVFIVMFFGLGVDFALHFSLRYQEATNRPGVAVNEALCISASSVGRAIALCTATTALGFLGFVPTDYQGLADLGVISAGGMLVACILTFTFLPAFYALVGAPRAHEIDLPSSSNVVQWLSQRRSLVLISVAVIGVGAVIGASEAKFDYSVLALKDPDAQSMQTFRELQREGLSTDYQLISVGAAPVDKSAVQALSVVDEVQVPADMVPDDQSDKLYVVEDLQQLLWSAVEPGVVEEAPSVGELRSSGQVLLAQVGSALGEGSHSAELRNALTNLRAGLLQLESASDDRWLAWQSGSLENLLQELHWLRRALNVSPIEFSDLPISAASRLVNEAGSQLSVITPSQDIADVNALSEFVTGVRELVPNATGRPVIEWGVGSIVVTSFQQALIFSALAIAAILLIALRNWRLVLLILLPLALTAVMTLAVGTLADYPLNMANILVLPLIFGLGVDNGIHVVDRYLGEGDVEHLMHSSTPRAVMLSALTTIGAFAALSFSPHAGTASIGLLLTIAVALLLIMTIFILPALLVRSAETQ